MKNTAGASQCMKLISLDIQFDEVDTVAGPEIIVQGYDIDGHSATRIAVSWIGVVINI